MSQKGSLARSTQTDNICFCFSLGKVNHVINNSRSHRLFSLSEEFSRSHIQFFFSNKHVGFKFLNLSMKLGKTVKANLNIPSHA